MSRIGGCPCGVEQHDTVFPMYNKVYVISDAALDGVMDYGREPVTINADRFDERAQEGYFCWQCGRLLVFEGDTLRVFEEVGVNHAAVAKEGA